MRYLLGWIRDEMRWIRLAFLYASDERDRGTDGR